MANNLVASAIAMIKSGDKNGGAKMLAGLVRKEPDNEIAWLWLAVCAPDVERRRQCLQQVLRINPNNQDAQKALNLQTAPRKKLDFSDVAGGATTDLNSEEGQTGNSADAALKTETVSQTFSDTMPSEIFFPEESDVISLVCPTCGGPLEPTLEEERYQCAYCGSQHLVRRDRGKVILEPLLKGLDEVQAGINRTASELTARRLQDEIEKLEEGLTLANRRLSQGGQFLLTGGFCLLLYFWGFRIGIILAIGSMLMVIALLLLSTGLQSRLRITQRIGEKQAQIEQRLR